MSTLIGAFFWIVDGMIEYYKFQDDFHHVIVKRPENILEFLFLNVPGPDLCRRMIFFVVCLICGLLVARFMGKHLEKAEALKASEVHYRRLHESMQDAFVQMDIDGRITNFNSAFQQMLSYPYQRLLQMTMADLTPLKWHSQDLTIVSEQILVEEKSEVFEKELIRNGGSAFPVELRYFLIRDDKETPISIWAIVRDITHRKEIEKEREKKLHALKRSNEDLQQFAYVASHDLQEPLRMVSSYTSLLFERYGKQLDEKAEKYINYAVEGAVRMQTLIQDLLTYSRVDTRGAELTRVDLNEIFKYAVENLSALISETRAEVTAGSLPLVNGDESQLVAVFQNLIHNSIKFRKKESPQIHIFARQQNRQWTIGVRDNGIGIEERHKERIFVIFQRLHARNEYSGTGIGLALCKRIIERHGGKIWFESQIGKGTTFFLTLFSPENLKEAD